MKIIKQVKAPIRIDFGGGTTDIYPFPHKYGGAVLNATIDRYIIGKIVRSNKKVSLEYHGNIPTSSGLGTSGVMNLVWLSLISNKNKFNKQDKIELAEKVYDLEKIFGGVNGRQDQYAAAFGGINFMEFKKEKVKVTPLKLPEKLITGLEDNMLLVYTEPHFAGSSNKNAIDNLKKGKNNQNLLQIKKIAVEMKNALLRRDLEKFAELLNAETEERKKLHKSTVPGFVRKIIKTGLQNGAVAAKVCGSGNGGSILFLGNKKRLKRKFKRKVIDFRFDFKGLKTIRQ